MGQQHMRWSRLGLDPLLQIRAALNSTGEWESKCWSAAWWEYVTFDAAVAYGTEIGLWKEDGEGNLQVLDSDKWDEFYSETVSVHD